METDLPTSHPQRPLPQITLDFPYIIPEFELHVLIRKLSPSYFTLVLLSGETRD